MKGDCFMSKIIKLEDFGDDPKNVGRALPGDGSACDMLTAGFCHIIASFRGFLYHAHSKFSL